MDKKFIFLMCSERSGSNFITKIMNNHSKVCGPSTKHIINPVARNYFRYQPFTSGSWERLLEDILNLFKVSFSTWKADFELDELKKNIPQADLSELFKYFFKKEAEANDKEYVFIKEIKLHEFYPFLKAYFPEIKFVYQVRDPRDMALSWKKSPSHKGGVVSAAKQWKNDQQQYLKIHALENSCNNIVLVKYEDLVSKPEEKLTEILKVINLSFEPDMMDMTKDKLTNKNAQQQKAWENLSKPVMKDNFNKWEKSLSANEIKYIEKICYFEMLQLGYRPKYTWEELEKIPMSEFNSYSQSEMNELEYNPTKGVTANMEAKKKFYQKNIQ